VSKREPRAGKSILPTFGDYRDQVRPLAPRARRVPPVKATAPQPRSLAPAGAPVFETSDDGYTVEGARAGFQDLLRQTKQGRFPIFDTLDLHGLTVDESRVALRRFCERVRGRTQRLVLVIHGKGAHSPGGRGVLRGEIAGLISAPPVSELALCFATASAKHGGSGAVYVLLAAWR
jgi:DNA-nicking Smr family endonuclease